MALIEFDQNPCQKYSLFIFLKINVINSYTYYN